MLFFFLFVCFVFVFVFVFVFPFPLLALFGFVYIFNLSQLQPVVEKAEKLNFIYQNQSGESRKRLPNEIDLLSRFLAPYLALEYQRDRAGSLIDNK